MTFARTSKLAGSNVFLYYIINIYYSKFMMPTFDKSLWMNPPEMVYFFWFLHYSERVCLSVQLWKSSLCDVRKVAQVSGNTLSQCVLFYCEANVWKHQLEQETKPGCLLQDVIRGINIQERLTFYF